MALALARRNAFLGRLRRVMSPLTSAVTSRRPFAFTWFKQGPFGCSSVIDLGGRFTWHASESRFITPIADF